MTNIIVPELGEGIKKATVACWHFQPGQAVKEGDDLVELVTDKASFNIAAEKSGILKQVSVSEGQEAAIGSAIGMIE